MKSRTTVSIRETPQSFGYPRNVIWTEEDEHEKIDQNLVNKVGAHFIGFKVMIDDNGRTDTHLSFSRDGLSWQRMPGDVKEISTLERPWHPRILDQWTTSIICITRIVRARRTTRRRGLAMVGTPRPVCGLGWWGGGWVSAYPGVPGGRRRSANDGGAYGTSYPIRSVFRRGDSCAGAWVGTAGSRGRVWVHRL